MGYDDSSIAMVKAKKFALDAIAVYKILLRNNEFVLSRQFLRSATSVGANIKEALRGQSRADFGAKMNIALKEACETEYWLELLTESGYLADGSRLLADNKELIKIHYSIVKTTFNNK